MYFGYVHGFSFFKTWREEHYQIMDDTVFHALTILPRNDCEYGYQDTQNKINLIVNSTVYEHASLHMKKDKPDLHKKIDHLNSEIKKHNIEVNKLNHLINNTLNNSFDSSILPPDFKLNLKDIKELSEEAWQYVFKKIIKLNNVQQFESEIDTYINNTLRIMESIDSELKIKHHIIAAGNQGEFNNIE